jgi:hypothetical protein
VTKVAALCDRQEAAVQPLAVHSATSCRGPRPHGPAFIALPYADRRKGDQVAATSIKRVCIDQLPAFDVTS